MALTEYFRKRDFKATPEPKGKKHASKKAKQKLMFVVHEHHASHLHYDFRLEWDGTLKSWAVPKGPSLDPHIKRLAVEVEDHPIEYGSFEGVIPKNQYGAGRVYIWDTGTWSPLSDFETGFKKGRIEFEMFGQKLKGKWILVKTKSSSSSKPQWLLMKRTDEFAQEGNVADVQGDDIVPKDSKTFGIKQSKPNAQLPIISSSKKKAQKQSPSEIKEKDFISPALAVLVSEPPEGADWVHETKFDGYRIQALVKKNKVKLYTRSGQDWTERFPLVKKDLQNRDLNHAVFDGEVVWIDDKGRSDFQKLQNAIKSDNQSQLFYYVFDLLKFDDHDIRNLPLIERKKILKEILGPIDSKSLIRFSDHSSKPGDDLLKAACSFKLEGLVSKLATSPYPKGRSGEWVKSKCISQQEFVIGGFTEGTGSRVGFGALLLGVYEKGLLRYVGKVGTGFTNESLKELKTTLAPLAQTASPFESSPGIPKKGVTWVKPKLSAEIVFANWTDDGQLRVPVFHGLREDKPATEIHEEVPMQKIENTETLKSSPLRRKRLQEQSQVKSKVPSKKVDNSSIQLTHPDKILYAKEKLTKLDVAQYYIQVAKLALPFVEDRPLTLVRCPEGTQKMCFYQKHISDSAPEQIVAIPIREKEKTNSYMSIQDAQGLVSLVQMGAFELHCWNSKRDHIENPDQIVMDFDPDPKIPWKKVVAAGFQLKEILDSLGLQSFVKLSGGKGLHVHIPFKPLYSWDQVKEFSKALALQLQKADPKLYVTKMSKTLRDKHIFIDYLRNARGATAVAPYSLRAKDTSSVAMPVSWAELKKIPSPTAFNLKEALRYLKNRKSDPWADYFHELQELPHMKVQV